MLQSHFNPYKSLKTHVAEVKNAAQIILSKHSPQTCLPIEKWIEWAVQFHDVGKGTRQFQSYIKNPSAYKGKRKEKAHTAMSLYWWLNYAFSENLDVDTTIAVAVAVWKHHSSFPKRGNLNGNGEDEFCYCISHQSEILDKQLKNFSLPLLEDALGIQLSHIVPFLPDSAEDFQYFSNYTFFNKSPEEAALLRLKTQLLYSVLLEADKAFLALDNSHHSQYKEFPVVEFPAESIDIFFKDQPSNTLNTLRTTVRKQIMSEPLKEINVVSLPTGLGKTMIAADWGLRYRDTESGHTRKVIIALPFLSIIDQTVKEYTKLFKMFGVSNAILEDHSLSERDYLQGDGDDADEDELKKTNQSRDFLADTWQKPFIITTFDQLLYALFSSKGKHQLRFHNLADALIIIDEIQSIPSTLWSLLSLAFSELTHHFNTRFLIMSATQPHFIKEYQELVQNPAAIFKTRKRYKFVFRHHTELDIDEFLNECKTRLKTEWKNKRVLLTFNTRASAKMALKELKESGERYLEKVFFLSADVIPGERLQQIEDIKQRAKDNLSCLVISTQCIEAGVDLDMQHVVRDFAPFDSLIQVAGRCNRNDRDRERGTVEIVKLKNKKKQLYCDMVYIDSTLLTKTSELLRDKKVLLEEEIYPLIQQYFSELQQQINTGKNLARQWAYWVDDIPVKTLLRGDLEKFEFVVASRDKEINASGGDSLEIEMEKAMAIEDRWERKRAIRTLAGRIAKVSVSVLVKPGLIPEKLARPLGHWWILYDHCYKPFEGILSSEDQDSFILL